ncbi:hypothetical protein ABE137_11960 [Brevibacillus laterosporus]|uniref:hol-like chemotaxis n=1 Tax=Brevibacillus phage Sundance TaxID=1691958 RepID=UPI0006BD6147|nr:hypothetical protein [Brevibacillus laterosporus]YP_009194107.1 hol-like chemotaxis [Brevibacillus phage Sundance]ALA47873.1 hypothetical protein SUNDANCE_57 [Brevibacillus phage Sundance]MCR8994678.1 hypothetical protein [Brevibacillus laterosporus]
MNQEILNVLLPVISAIVGSVGTYFVTRSNNKKELTINDRQLYVEDEKSFREDEKVFRQELRSTIAEYKNELDEARKEIKLLTEEVAKLHQVNLVLTLENKQLQKKVDELRTELQGFKRGE